MQKLTPLDAWVLSTYQRLESLDVPVFDLTTTRDIRPLPRTVSSGTLYSLPTALPRQLKTLGAYLQDEQGSLDEALSAVQKLSLLFRYLASPLRFEPYNESPVHKAVPSARCMYPLQFVLLFKQAERIQAYSYQPDFHALQPMALPASPDLASAPDGASLLCVAQIWKTAEKYGEFAHFPVVLEAGHAYSQSLHLRGLLGWDTSRSPIAAESMHCLAKGQWEMVLFSLSLDELQEQHLQALPCATAQLARVGENPGLSERFARLPAFNTLFKQGRRLTTEQPGGRIQSPAGKPTDKDFLQLCRARHSGNDRSGLAPVLARVPARTLTTVQTTFDALRHRRGIGEEETHLKVSFAWLAGGDVKVGLYDLQGRWLTPQMDEAEFIRHVRRILPYKLMRFNTSAMSLIVFFSTDPVQALERFGEAAFRNMHMAAGAAAQDMSLTAAAMGMFSRPVRMMREERIEQALPVGGQVLYQVLCGFNRRSNLTFEVL
ncbi:nitroreductase family protein [Bowmanella dokdonensis]|uniref:Nitroreductase family protein n=1 Tax=Bowmanella dokdonensis TaxID=751969 RepID=A0A939DJL6_9ALTE|nr:nitroreductase family protein [Bowmanella dokdonensis]MBN7823939.1 nitroreductase family protein [Bowmanella dokdonensis]